MKERERGNKEERERERERQKGQLGREENTENDAATTASLGKEGNDPVKCVCGGVCVCTTERVRERGRKIGKKRVPLCSAERVSHSVE